MKQGVTLHQPRRQRQQGQERLSGQRQSRHTHPHERHRQLYTLLKGETDNPAMVQEYAQRIETASQQVLDSHLEQSAEPGPSAKPEA